MGKIRGYFVIRIQFSMHYDGNQTEFGMKMKEYGLNEEIDNGKYGMRKLLSAVQMIMSVVQSDEKNIDFVFFGVNCAVSNQCI